jgi:hypothetical protein
MPEQLLIQQDPEAWHAGYMAGLDGRLPPTPIGVDGLAFQAGVADGRTAATISLSLCYDSSSE